MTLVGCNLDAPRQSVVNADTDTGKFRNTRPRMRGRCRALLRGPAWPGETTCQPLLPPSEEAPPSVRSPPEAGAGRAPAKRVRARTWNARPTKQFAHMPLSAELNGRPAGHDRDVNRIHAGH